MFVYLTGGDAIWRWIQGRSSPGNRDRVAVGGAVAWNAASSKVRGIALVAFDRQFGARSKAEQEHSGAAPIAQRRPGPAEGDRR